MSTTKIKVGIIGGAGYTGGELIRLLINHPAAEISFINSKSSAGKLVHSVHQDLLGDTELQFTDDLSALENGNINVLFLCLGHGDSKKFLKENNVHDTVKIIDLANDFRLTQNSQLRTHSFIYGLPELNRDAIKTAQYVANPGCFATAVQLGLLPLAKAGLLKDIYTTGITGSTGAGQGLAATSHFSWRANNIQAYKTLTHQHLAEIGQSIKQLEREFAAGAVNASNDSPSGNGGGNLNFVPWRGDFTRGIFISSQLQCDLDIIELKKLFRDFYAGQPFTHISDDAIFLKQVVNSNKCIIQLEKVGTMLVVHSAIDNLLKGASGQAVQNMNLMFGLEEVAGLRLKPVAF